MISGELQAGLASPDATRCLFVARLRLVALATSRVVGRLRRRRRSGNYEDELLVRLNPPLICADKKWARVDLSPRLATYDRVKRPQVNLSADPG